MKKLVRITFFILLGLLVATGDFSSNTVQVEAAKKTSSKKTTKKTSKKVVSKKKAIVVSNSKKASAKKLTTKIKNWKLKNINGLKGIVDQDILDGFAELGFTVTINKAEANRYGYTGCFSPSRQLIILKKANTQTLLHEVGHFVDFLRNYESCDAQFKKIYKAEKKKAKSFFNTPSHTLASPKEFFAESFNQYYSNPEKLKTKCPKTYAYMEKAINSITPEQVTYIKDYYGL